MSFYIVDTETTGLTEKDQVIELAYFNLATEAQEHRQIEGNPIDNLEVWMLFSSSAGYGNYLFKPSVPIHPKAQEIHGLSYKDLTKYPPSSSLKLPEDLSVMIGHNILFDWRMLGKPPVSLICTKQLARKAWPKNTKGKPFPENYQLSTLIRFLYPEEADILLDRKFHRALDDCRLTYLVLVKLLEHYKMVEDLEQLVLMCSQGK